MRSCSFNRSSNYTYIVCAYISLSILRIFAFNLHDILHEGGNGTFSVITIERNDG